MPRIAPVLNHRGTESAQSHPHRKHEDTKASQSQSPAHGETADHADGRR